MPEIVRYVVTQTRQVEISTAKGIEDALAAANLAFSNPGEAKAMNVGVRGWPTITSTTIERDR